MKKTVSWIIAILFICSLSGAEDSGSEGRRSRRERGERMGSRRTQMLEDLKSKYPAEVAELEKLRTSDPEAARTKMRELMNKAGMSFPGRNRRPERMAPQINLTEEQIKEIKSKLPEEFAEYEKLKASAPEKASVKLMEMAQKVFGEQLFNRKNLRDRQRRSTAWVKRELARRYPERYAEAEKLSSTDPDGARQLLRKLYKDAGLFVEPGAGELVYEYVDPKNNNNMRNNMMQRNFPMWGGGRMMGPPGWDGGGR